MLFACHRGYCLAVRYVCSRLFFYARYIDWLLTTPLLLYDLASVAGVESGETFGIIGLDVLMIVAGLIGSTQTPEYRWIFWAFGMLTCAPCISCPCSGSQHCIIMLQILAHHLHAVEHFQERSREGCREGCALQQAHVTHRHHMDRLPGAAHCCIHCISPSTRNGLGLPNECGNRATLPCKGCGARMSARPSIA